jgi:hypothetical protein
MGGIIGLTIREAIGKETRTVVHTGVPHRFINNMSLLKKDTRHVQRYFGKKSKLKMPEEADTHAFLAPIDYGLVVVDYVHDQILVNDGFGGIGYVTYPDFVVAKYHGVPAFGRSVIEEELGKREFLESRVLALAKAGRVVSGETINLEEEKAYQMDLRGIPYQDICSKLEIFEREGKGRCRTLDFDLSPFQLTDFMDYSDNWPHNTKEGIEKMKVRIKELGFKLSPEEENAWNNWVLEKKEQYEDVTGKDDF